MEGDIIMVDKYCNRLCYEDCDYNSVYCDSDDESFCKFIDMYGKKCCLLTNKNTSDEVEMDGKQ